MVMSSWLPDWKFPGGCWPGYVWVAAWVFIFLLRAWLCLVGCLHSCFGWPKMSGGVLVWLCLVGCRYVFCLVCSLPACFWLAAGLVMSGLLLALVNLVGWWPCYVGLAACPIVCWPKHIWLTAGPVM